MVFLLNIFDNGFALGKCFFSILKNNFPILVFTLKEKGGLNHIIFLLLFLFSSFRVFSSPSLLLYFNSSLKPLLRSACSYVDFAASKISKQIKRDSKIFVPADKSHNIYRMDRETYEKLLHENITKTYKKTDKKKVTAINIDAKKIAKDLELENRIEKMQESECYITVKDHKEDFPHKISCRLINPSKSDIGKRSKIIPDKINSDVLSSVQVNQWKNSQAVIEWFKNI